MSDLADLLFPADVERTAPIPQVGWGTVVGARAVARDNDGSVYVHGDLDGAAPGDRVLLASQGTATFVVRRSTPMPRAEIGPWETVGARRTLADTHQYLSFPCLIRLDSGRLLASWSASADHYGAGVGRLAWSDNGGTTWTSPIIPVNHGVYARAIVSLASLGNRVAMLQLHDDPPRRRGVVYVTTNPSSWGSPAATLDWESPQWIFPSHLTWIDNGTTDGLMLATCYGEEGVIVSASTDAGATWTRRAVAAGSFTAGWSEATITHMGGPNLLMMLRRDSNDHIYRLTSEDYGQSWSVPTSVLTQTSGLPIPTLLPSGVLVMPARDQTADGTPQSWALAESRDGGATWFKRHLSDDWMMYGQIASTGADTALLIGAHQDRALHTNADVWLQDLRWPLVESGGEGTGIDPTGVTDSRAGINRALASGDLTLPAGTYFVSGPIVAPSGRALRGAGRGRTIITTTHTGSALVQMSGTIDAPISLAANVSAGATQITVTNAATLTVGDLLLLGDDTVPDDNYAERTSGELIRVAAKSGNTLTILSANDGRGIRGTFVSGAAAPIQGYTTAAGGYVRKVNPVKGCAVSDLSLIGNPIGGGASGGIRVLYGSGVHITGVEVSDFGGSGITVISCEATSISDVWAHDLGDGPGQFGYGVNVVGASTMTTVTGSLFERVRHGVTTNGHDGRDGTNLAGGIPDNLTVDGCRAKGTHNSAFDTHAAGMTITFSNCSAVDCYYGFSVRAKRVTISGCDVYNPTSDGLVSWTGTRWLRVDGLTVRGGWRGINITHGRDIDITDPVITGTRAHGIRLYPETGHGDTVRIFRPRVIDAGSESPVAQGVFIDAPGRSRLLVQGGWFERTSASLLMASGVHVADGTAAIVTGVRGTGTREGAAPIVYGPDATLHDNVSL